MNRITAARQYTFSFSSKKEMPDIAQHNIRLILLPQPLIKQYWIILQFTTTTLYHHQKKTWSLMFFTLKQARFYHNLASYQKPFKFVTLKKPQFSHNFAWNNHHTDNLISWVLSNHSGTTTNHHITTSTYWNFRLFLL